MLVDAILSGLQVVSSASAILKAANLQQANAELEETVRRVELLIRAIHRIVDNLGQSSALAPRAFESYKNLVNILKASGYYGAHIEFRPTENGTWLILKKRGDRGKTSVLRDPRGEYGQVVDIKDTALVEIDENGNPRPVVQLVSLLPEIASASRCKDHMQIREVIALRTVKLLLQRRNSKASANKRFRWLDLCCGRGNILGQLKKILGSLGKNLEYWGVDVHPDHLNECKRICRSEKLVPHYLAKVNLEHREITSDPLPKRLGQFDFVTLLNVLHEIHPLRLFEVLTTAIDRCKISGQVLIVDMEEHPHLEWEAIMWSKQSVARLFDPLLRKDQKALVTPDKQLIVSSYSKSVNVLAVDLYKRNFDRRALIEDRSKVRTKFLKNVREILRKMHKETTDKIKSIYDENTVGIDKKQRMLANLRLRQLLWRYWAITEALKTR